MGAGSITLSPIIAPYGCVPGGRDQSPPIFFSHSWIASVMAAIILSRASSIVLTSFPCACFFISSSCATTRLQRARRGAPLALPNFSAHLMMPGLPQRSPVNQDSGQPQPVKKSGRNMYCSTSSRTCGAASGACSRKYRKVSYLLFRPIPPRYPGSMTVS